MVEEKHVSQLGFKDIPLVFLIGILSFIVHELSHGLCGELLGYEMFVGINKAGLASGEYSNEWHRQLVSAAGPIVTVSIALAGLGSIYRYGLTRLFPVVFFSAMMRALATFVSLTNPNDEARVSQWLGLGKWTLPLLVMLALGWMVFLASRRLGLSRRSWAICFVASSIAITVVVLTEPSWPVLNLGN